MSGQFLELMFSGPEIPVEAAVGSDIGIVAVVYEILDGNFSTFFILIQLHELGSGVGTYVTLPARGRWQLDNNLWTPEGIVEAGCTW